MDNLRPIGLAQPRKPVLRHARMTGAVGFQQRPVNEGVLGVNVKDARAETLEVRDRINKLANQMARVPFQAKVGARSGVEQALPHGRLAQDVVMHQRQMPGPLRTVLEGDADV